MITLEKILALKSVYLFSYTPEEVLVEVALAAREQLYAAGKHIIKKDHFGDTMYVILSGKVKVHDGEIMLAELHGNDVFGELSALLPEKRIASVTALEDTMVLKISSEDLYQLMDLHSGLAKGIIQFLCMRMRERSIAKPNI